VNGTSLRQSLQTTRPFPLTPFSWRQRKDEIEFVTFPHSKHARCPHRQASVSLGAEQLRPLQPFFSPLHVPNSLGESHWQTGPASQWEKHHFWQDQNAWPGLLVYFAQLFKDAVVIVKTRIHSGGRVVVVVSHLACAAAAAVPFSSSRVQGLASVLSSRHLLLCIRLLELQSAGGAIWRCHWKQVRSMHTVASYGGNSSGRAIAPPLLCSSSFNSYIFLKSYL
jgi:hypothetical protein